ncbi:MAG: hypothetical protein NUW01_09395 [Gemmatimonadaceae bacterium]|nr:hypothetical protein [Gemmatimonadaceae bacterium]
MNGNTANGSYYYPTGDYWPRPTYQPWPPTTYVTYPVPISDADVERIAVRVVALLDERTKPRARKPAAKKPAAKKK